MPNYTGADLFVDALAEYGVRHVFGNPGTTELPVTRAIDANPDIEYVLGLHEDVAVGMASGYASTRRYHSYHDGSFGDGGGVTPVGVANLHVTPGLAHGLGNLYAAKWAGAPLVVTAGNHERDFRHEEPILSGDLARLADGFCKWSDEVLDPSALPTMLRRAVRTALTPPTGPVFLALPLDVMRSSADPTAVEPLGPIPNTGRGDPAALSRAADLLVDADDPVFVVGDHVARAGHEAVAAAVEFAEACGARVHGEILACEVSFPTGHDQWVSYLPPDEDLASLLLDSDTLVFAGISSNTTLTGHDSPLVGDDATCVHLGHDPWQLGKNHPAAASVVGDPGLLLADLADRLTDRLSDATREERLDKVETLKASLSGTIESMGVDETPAGETRAAKHELVDAMRAVAPDAFVVDEGVTAKYPLLTRWEMEPEQLLSNKGGGLGYGLPAAVGAAIAESMRPNPRQVIGYVGDGSYLYYPHAVYTAARRAVDLTVVIPDNRNYRILKDNAAEMFDDDPEGAHVGTDFEPPVDLVANAESHGARATRIETPDGIEPALETALDRDGPDVLDVLVHD
jgi:benzoylformate decarboxylase